MNILYQNTLSSKVAMLSGDGCFIKNTQDALDVMASIRSNGCDRVVIPKDNLPAEFFELRTGVAGEILQKFVNYQMKIAIVGEFECYQSKSLHDFIYECNKGRHVFFQKNMEDAVEALARAT